MESFQVTRGVLGSIPRTGGGAGRQLVYLKLSLGRLGEEAD